MIPFLDAEQVEDALPYADLIASIKEAFRRSTIHVPARQHYLIEAKDEPIQTLLLMPAWEPAKGTGLKMVTIHPGNKNRALPAIQGLYILLDGSTGKLKLLLDGPTLTARRTAATSALAAAFLARKDSGQIMLMVGTGALSLPLMAAHSSRMSFEHIYLWGRDFAKAQNKAHEAQKMGLPVEAVRNLDKVACRADLISCATLSHTPLIEGKWLKPGCHIDLVGGFTPQMREADDEAILRAALFVDTKLGALAEAGDIIDPLSRGIIKEADIKADLFDLCQGKHSGRQSQDEITLFKSVGNAIEDLAAALLAARTSEPL